MTGPAGPAAPRAAVVDLHSHSTASDGALPPEAVVDAARAAGLTAIALTDHDTMAGVPAAREAGERLGVRVVAGVELSAHLREREIHMLGLHVTELDALEQQLVRFRADRVGRAEQIVGKLNALGMPLSMDAVLEAAKNGAVGRPHVAKAMIAGGYAKDNREAFDRWLGNGKPAYVDKPRLEIADAIRLVHEAGGVAVWAHPGPEGTKEAVAHLVGLGLDGLEVKHPGHSESDTQRLAALVENHGLVPSGGSDWHGATEGPRVLGCMQVPLAWMERQEERIRRRAPARVA